MNPDFDRTRQCVDHYRKLGLCPLPSKMHVKGPMLATYAEHYGPAPVPESVYAGWQTTNVQIVTGTRSPTPTKVIVVDLDGPEALDAWGRITGHHGYAPGRRGWVATTGGGGRHLYYLLPDGLAACPSGIVWGLFDTWGWDAGDKAGRGGWCKHKEVRILADNNLVVAPPSVHVETGNRYRFDADSGPNVRRLPEPAPDWLLALPRLTAPRCTGPPAPRPTPAPSTRRSDHYYTREEVLAAVGDRKFGIAVNEWGLASPVAAPNPSGWCICYVPGREDPRHSRPSGSFHFLDGTLQDRRDLTSISFFDLGVLLGRYQTWQECRDDLGDRFLGGFPRRAAL